MSAAAAPHIDAASLVAFPAERPTRDIHSREVASARALCDEALRGEPLLSHAWENAYGRVGVIMIPVVDMTLFDDRRETVAAAVAGVALAARLGARCVSFTGMIPAATDYGRAIAAGVAGGAGGREPGPVLSTGHAAVVAAFAFNVEALLAAAGRTYGGESIAFVGVGSIGEGILRLLNDHARPREICVVDIHEQRARLERVKKEIDADFEIVTIDRRAGLPAWMYDRYSLFLSATSTPVVIDVTRLRPGSLMVDDSFPFGFDAERAVSRLTRTADIRITIAGGLRGVAPFSLVHRIAGASRGHEFELLLDRMEQIINPWPRCMTGCVYSSLLTNHHDLPPTLGPVTYEDAKRFYETLKSEGFQGTPPHIFTFNPAHGEPIQSMPGKPLAYPCVA